MDPQMTCPVCGHVITKPVCQDCLEKEMRTWLFETRKDLVPLLESISEPLKSITPTQARCVICGKEMRICSYCYTKNVFEELVEEVDELHEEFFMMFDYNEGG